jgi:hypothetical protein
MWLSQKIGLSWQFFQAIATLHAPAASGRCTVTCFSAMSCVVGLLACSVDWASRGMRLANTIEPALQFVSIWQANGWGWSIPPDIISITEDCWRPAAVRPGVGANSFRTAT